MCSGKTQESLGAAVVNLLQLDPYPQNAIIEAAAVQRGSLVTAGGCTDLVGCTVLQGDARNHASPRR